MAVLGISFFEFLVSGHVISDFHCSFQVGDDVFGHDRTGFFDVIIIRILRISRMLTPIRRRILALQRLSPPVSRLTMTMAMINEILNNILRNSIRVMRRALGSFSGISISTIFVIIVIVIIEEGRV